jgi:hypothetical protein
MALEQYDSVHVYLHCAYTYSIAFAYQDMHHDMMTPCYYSLFRAPCYYSLLLLPSFALPVLLPPLERAIAGALPRLLLRVAVEGVSRRFEGKARVSTDPAGPILWQDVGGSVALRHQHVHRSGAHARRAVLRESGARTVFS